MRTFSATRALTQQTESLDFWLGAPMYREVFPYLGEEFAVNARLPGTRQRWVRHGAVLVGYVCLATLTIALGSAPGRKHLRPVGYRATSSGTSLFSQWRGW
jgi:hypothetical protein